MVAASKYMYLGDRRVEVHGEILMLEEQETMVGVQQEVVADRADFNKELLNQIDTRFAKRPAKELRILADIWKINPD